MSLCYSDCNTRIACPLFIHSNQLIFLLEIKMLTFNHGANILYKVLTCTTWIAIHSYAQCAHLTSQETHMQ